MSIPCWFVRVLTVAVVVGVALGGPLAPVLARTAADVSGTTYTSPTYGYSLTWPDAWSVVDERSEPPTDAVTISNRYSFVTLLGYAALGSTPEADLGAFVGDLESDPAVSDLRELGDADAPATDQDGASTFYAYTLTRDDGSVDEVYEYIHLRSVARGQAIVAFLARTLADNYPYEISDWEQILNSFTAPPEPTGEAAPAFASGPWRLGIVSAAIAYAFPDFGLTVASGQEWAVVIVDVTNWSPDAARFDTRDAALRTLEAPDAVLIDPAATNAVASALKLIPRSGATTRIAAGATKRIVLVFVVPEDGSEPSLTLGDATLPLHDAFAADFAPETLPDSPAPATVETGKVTTVVDNDTLKIRIDGATRTVTFLGVDVADATECAGVEAAAFVAKLKGRTVLIEHDPNVESETAAYVWLRGGDGSRTLVNDQLVADGYGRTRAFPTSVRFGAWLLASEADAQRGTLGLWRGCPT